MDSAKPWQTVTARWAWSFAALEFAPWRLSLLGTSSPTMHAPTVEDKWAILGRGKAFEKKTVDDAARCYSGHAE
jgi:hypothetical protein